MTRVCLASIGDGFYVSSIGGVAEDEFNRTVGRTNWSAWEGCSGVGYERVCAYTVGEVLGG